MSKATVFAFFFLLSLILPNHYTTKAIHNSKKCLTTAVNFIGTQFLLLTFKNQLMKRLILFFFLLTICHPLYPQKNQLFVRVYDLNDKKINKGFVIAVNDSLLRIKKDTSYVDIPVKTIGTIRTKKSVGNNVLIGSLMGAAVVGGIGAATAEPDAEIMGYTAGEGFIIGVIFGAPTGAIIGTFSAGLKNSKTFKIDGDLEKWKAFREHLTATGKRGN